MTLDQMENRCRNRLPTPSFFPFSCPDPDTPQQRYIRRLHPQSFFLPLVFPDLPFCCICNWECPALLLSLCVLSSSFSLSDLFSIFVVLLSLCYYLFPPALLSSFFALLSSVFLSVSLFCSHFLFFSVFFSLLAE